MHWKLGSSSVAFLFLVGLACAASTPEPPVRGRLQEEARPIAANAPRPAGAPSVKDTRMLARPACSETHIAFEYADDLWVANMVWCPWLLRHSLSSLWSIW